MGTIDIEPFLESALEEVVETIMNFGVYPQPRRNHSQRILFDLYEWIEEKNVIDPSDLREYLILSINDHSRTGEFERKREQYEKRIEQLLIGELRDTVIVHDRAEELAEQERE